VRSNHEHKNIESDLYRELRLLEEVGRTPEMSQRRLAHQLGIALGVTNVLVRSLARKGYIRIVQVKWKRWIYILTPAGITRKIQLTLTYVEGFLDHYRRVRELLREDLGALALSADSRIAIYGATELAELMFLVLRDLGITNIEIIDRPLHSDRFLGMPIKSLDSIAPKDYVKILVAFPSDVEDRCQDLRSLGVSPSQTFALLLNSRPDLNADHQEEWLN